MIAAFRRTAEARFHFLAQRLADPPRGLGGGLGEVAGSDSGADAAGFSSGFSSSSSSGPGSDSDSGPAGTALSAGSGGAGASVAGASCAPSDGSPASPSAASSVGRILVAGDGIWWGQPSITVELRHSGTRPSTNLTYLRARAAAWLSPQRCARLPCAFAGLRGGGPRTPP